MNSEEAERAKPGDEVLSALAENGQILRITSSTFTVKWKDGQEGTYQKPTPPEQIVYLGPKDLGEAWLRRRKRRYSE